MMTDAADNYGTKTVKGRFQPGNKGRPRGAKNKVNRLTAKLLADNAQDLVKTCIEKALGGDMLAMRLCIERIMPMRRGAAVTFDLPQVKTAADADAAMGALLAACSRGQITPDECMTLTKALRDKTENLRVVELEERIVNLERRAGSHLRPVS